MKTVTVKIIYSPYPPTSKDVVWGHRIDGKVEFKIFGDEGWTVVAKEDILSDIESAMESSEEYTDNAIKEAVTDKLGAVNGIATLDDAGKVPSSQLPSYVDDVVEYNSLSDFPEEGETGKIYVAKDTGLVYRWSGSEYFEISNREQEQADWNQNDDTKVDYVKNKPAIKAGIGNNSILENNSIGVKTKYYSITWNNNKFRGSSIIPTGIPLYLTDDCTGTSYTCTECTMDPSSIMYKYIYTFNSNPSSSTRRLYLGNQNNGQNSHAEGNSIALGMNAHSEGNNTLASGDASHAEGNSTIANGLYAHAEGANTYAYGTSHAEGQSTVAKNSGAHAEGGYTEANAVRSHAEGLGTLASSGSQHVFGEYNIEDNFRNTANAWVAGRSYSVGNRVYFNENIWECKKANQDSVFTYGNWTEIGPRGTYVEVVGNGTSSQRSNARTLDWQGNQWLAGNDTALDFILKNNPNVSLSGIASIVNNLPAAALSGSYDDLSNKPDLSVYALVANLALVATSGSYNDLTDTPIIPAAQIQSDWDQSDSEALDFIKNKPEVTNQINKNNHNAVQSSAVAKALEGKLSIEDFETFERSVVFNDAKIISSTGVPIQGLHIHNAVNVYLEAPTGSAGNYSCAIKHNKMSQSNNDTYYAVFDVTNYAGTAVYLHQEGADKLRIFQTSEDSAVTIKDLIDAENTPVQVLTPVKTYDNCPWAYQNTTPPADLTIPIAAGMTTLVVYFGNHDATYELTSTVMEDAYLNSIDPTSKNAVQSQAVYSAISASAQDIEDILNYNPNSNL